MQKTLITMCSALIKANGIWFRQTPPQQRFDASIASIASIARSIANPF